MAHKTDASGEYPLPAEVVRFIYDYYFDAPEILAADKEFYALCVDGTLHVFTHDSGKVTYTNIERIASNDLDPGGMVDGLSSCLVITRSGNIFARGKTSGKILTPHGLSRYPTSVYHTPRTFAVLFSNGDQVFRGDTDRWQPNLGKLDLSKVDTLFANKSWFAALMKDKTVQTWPAKDAELENQMNIDSKELDGVVSIYSTWGAFAALRGDGTVVTWGDMRCGGYVKERLTEVKDIFNTHAAFAALKKDGTVVTWGSPGYGGDSRVVSKELEEVEDICATARAFAARRRDGSVVTWGGNTYDNGFTGKVTTLPPVIDIKSTEDRFGAMTRLGRFVTWGHPMPSIEYPVPKAFDSYHVTKIYSTRSAFTAIADITAFTPRKWRRTNVTRINSRHLRRVVSRGEHFLATTDTGDVAAWGETDTCRFADLMYADAINEHHMSIRAAFQNAMGMEWPPGDVRWVRMKRVYGR